MRPLTSLSFALAALTSIPLVSAHGWVNTISVNGKTYNGANPAWFKQKLAKTGPAWFSENYGQQDPFFSEAVDTGNTSCHINAVSGPDSIPVKPGDTLELKWETPDGPKMPWRPSHEGPVLDYMAKCDGPCQQMSADQLKFFKIAEAGMYVAPHQPGAKTPFGTWGTDTLRDNDNIWKVTVPQKLSGPHVLRTEPIALMGAGNLGHAQMYPQCINLDIDGSDGVDPCTSGADCRLGKDLYTQTDPGLYISIHVAIDKYIIPGPAVWQGAKRKIKRVAYSFRA